MFLYCVHGLMCSFDASSRHSQLSEDTAGSALIIQHIHTSLLWNIFYHCVQYSLCTIGPILLYLFVCVACDPSPLAVKCLCPHEQHLLTMAHLDVKLCSDLFTSFASCNTSHISIVTSKLHSKHLHLCY